MSQNDEMNHQEVLFNIRTLEGYIYPPLILLPVKILIKYYPELVICRNIYLGSSDIPLVISKVKDHLNGIKMGDLDVEYLLTKFEGYNTEKDWMEDISKVEIHEKARLNNNTIWISQMEYLKTWSEKLRNPDIELRFNVSTLIFTTHCYMDLFIISNKPWEYNIPDYEQIYKTMIMISKLKGINIVLERSQQVMKDRTDHYIEVLGMEFVSDIYAWFLQVKSYPILDLALRSFVSDSFLRESEEEIRSLINGLLI